MVRRRLLFVIVAVLVAAVPHAVRAQSSSQSAYMKMLERYQAGDPDAPAALAALDDKQVEAGERALRSAFESSRVDSSGRAAGLMRLALVAHTDAAFATLLLPIAPEWSRDLGIAQHYAEELQSRNKDDETARRWWLLAIAYTHGRRNFSKAVVLTTRARQLGGDSAALELALGITHESAWTWVHEQDFKDTFKGSLEEAQKAYAAALALDPDLLEARVRLGRVRALRGESGAAARVLSEVTAPGDRGLAYLARLFEGDALERAGNLADAEVRYGAAIQILPREHSAHMALAHVRHLRGARAEAANEVRSTAADGPGADETDPWFWYSFGLASRRQTYFAELRAMVRK